MPFRRGTSPHRSSTTSIVLPGRATWNVFGTPYECIIDSVAPLPPDIHEIMLSLDRKGRDAEHRDAENPDREWKPGDNPLTEEQKRGLLFVYDFYRTHPL
jgi:hypothetical protein